MKKHIIFDFDDTISSSYELNRELFIETITTYKPEADRDFVRSLHYEMKGCSMEAIFEIAIKKFKIPKSALELTHENELLHQRKAIEVTIFPGIKKLVSHMKKQGKIVSICTNRAHGSLMEILKKNDLLDYFDNIISCSEVDHEKPDPHCLLELIKKYPDISKHDIIYFGDSKTDILFAENAGVDFLIIDHYLNKKQSYLMLLESFTDSMEILQN